MSTHSSSVTASPVTVAEDPPRPAWDSVSRYFEELAMRTREVES